MILKFDHITYSCDATQDVATLAPPHYTEVFREMDIDNIPCKRKYLRYGSPTHSILMFAPVDDIGGGLPIEFTQYPKVSPAVSPFMHLEGESIQWEVADAAAASRLFQALGAKVLDDGVTLEIAPFLEKRKIRIQLQENVARKTDSFLDVEGYSSIGLFVDNIPKHLEKCEGEGFSTSIISEIQVQGRLLDIAFVEGANGELIELISLAKERK